MKLLPTFVGFCVGVLTTSALVAVVRRSHASPELALDRIVAVADPEPKLTEQSTAVETVEMLELGMVEATSRGNGMLAFSPDKTQSMKARFERVGGAFIAMRALMAWVEICDAEGYPRPSFASMDYLGLGQRIMNASSADTAWLRCKAGMRPYVEASMIADGKDEMWVDVGVMQWEGSARGALMSHIRDFLDGLAVL